MSGKLIKLMASLNIGKRNILIKRKTDIGYRQLLHAIADYSSDLYSVVVLDASDYNWNQCNLYRITSADELGDTVETLSVAGNKKILVLVAEFFKDESFSSIEFRMGYFRYKNVTFVASFSAGDNILDSCQSFKKLYTLTKGAGKGKLEDFVTDKTYNLAPCFDKYSIEDEV